MRAVVALFLAVLFVVIVVYLTTQGYGDEDEERSSGSGWRIIDALIHIVSWWRSPSF